MCLLIMDIQPHCLCPLPPLDKLVSTLLGELLTFLFVKNTFQALTPLADAHTPTISHPQSVLSSLNFSILDYLITLPCKPPCS